MPTTYTVPDSPADPEAAALELIVRLPAETILHTEGFTPILQDYCALLHAEECFAGLSWSDAKAIAEAFIRRRARNVLGRRDGMEWDDRERAARALNIAATVLGLRRGPRHNKHAELADVGFMPRCTAGRQDQPERSATLASAPEFE